MAKYCDFDIEAHNVGRQYGMEPHDYVRLFQYSLDDAPVELLEIHTRDDLEQAKDILRSSDYVSGHNINDYDLSVMFGVDSTEPLEMAMDNRVIDTFTIASIVTPAPMFYTDRLGKRQTTYQQGRQNPKMVAKYLKLENLTHQFNLPGKFGELRDLAKKYNPKGTLVADLDYSLIPLDDPDFREYARQDVVAGRALRKYLVNQIHETGYSAQYVWRELKLAAIAAQISRNGVNINVEKAQSRVDYLLAQREPLMKTLVEDFGFPTEGKQPWKSNDGKAAILKALESFGITPDHPKWEKTATGNPSFGGEVMVAVTEGTEAEEFGAALATLQGQRSLAELALKSVYEDGKAHPNITSLQRSGRWSFTEPGLTVWTKNEEKSYIVSAPGHSFVELDFNAADARAMAALSGDAEFAKRFETDENGNALHDAHNLTGVAAFGEDTYYGDGPRDASARPVLRDPSKVIGHGSNYNMGNWKLAVKLNETCEKLGIDMHFWSPLSKRQREAGVPEIPRYEHSISVPDMTEKFNRTFAWLKRYKDSVVEEGKSGWVTNTWGRRMMVDEGRSYNQSPALHGQSTTREMMGDALIRIAERGMYYIRGVKAIIHDALLVEFPDETVEKDALVIKDCMEAVFDPGTPVGMPIEFPVGMGHPAKDWHQAAH